MTIAPRDYRQPGRVLKQDLSTLLAASPEAFDCLVWIAKDSSHDEQVTVEQDVVGSIESGERAQSYEKPIQARARIVPDEALAFGVLSSALAENFIGASQPMRIILSVPGARKYSLIQWLEFPTLDAESRNPERSTSWTAPLSEGHWASDSCTPAFPSRHSVKSRPPHRKRKARCSPAARKMTS